MIPQEPQAGLFLDIAVWDYFNQLFANRALVTEEGHQQMLSAFNSLYEMVQTQVAQRDAEWKAWAQALAQAGVEAERELADLKAAIADPVNTDNEDIRELVQMIAEETEEYANTYQLEYAFEVVHMEIFETIFQMMNGHGFGMMETDELVDWLVHDEPLTERIKDVLQAMINGQKGPGTDTSRLWRPSVPVVEGEFEEEADDEE